MNKLIRGIAYGVLLLPGIVLMDASQGIFGVGTKGLALSLMLYVAVLFITILIHETGHALAALAMGWRVTLFAVFPLAYRIKKRRLEFWTLPSGDLGGAVAVDTGWRGETWRQNAFFAAAGPVANLAVAFLAFIAAHLWPDLQDFAGCLAVSSLFVGVGNLLPWKARNGMKSDGARIAAALQRLRPFAQ